MGHHHQQRQQYGARNRVDPATADEDQHSRLQWSLRSLRADFKVKNNELYFRRYQARLSSRLFAVALLLNLTIGGGDLLLRCDALFEPEQQQQQPRWPNWVRGTALLAYASLLFWHWRHERRLNRPRRKGGGRPTWAAVLAWLTMVAGHWAAAAATSATAKPSARPPPLLFFLILCNETLLAFRPRILAIGSWAPVVLLQLLVAGRWPPPAADMLFYLAAGLVALYVTYLLEIVNRRAFLDHRRCVESKFKLNFERDEQERLLASCLPRHLMTKVRDDIRARFLSSAADPPLDGNNNHDDDGDPEEETVAGSRRAKSASHGSIGRPFRELYIDKWPDVTVLYADIVNSMALTQRLPSAKALVETLNSLVCRFDSRAERHDCLRIKILGDCYYCISGLPEHGPRQHATNCLLMGLDMIDIIREFRHEADIDVDMRIGIHTGMVLSGLLGRKKWQFDIWSLDAMKASLMEQQGRPGFVHVTQATLDHIPGETLARLAIQEQRCPENADEDAETTYLIRWRDRQDSVAASTAMITAAESPTIGGGGRRCRPLHQVVNSLRNYGAMIRYSNDSLSKTIDNMSLSLNRQYDIRRDSIDIHPVFLFFIRPGEPDSDGGRFWYHLRRVHRVDWRREWHYFRQVDHLFPHYLVGTAVLAMSILLLRWLRIGHHGWRFWFRDPATLACYLAAALCLCSLAYSLLMRWRWRRPTPVALRLLVWTTVAGALLAACHLDAAMVTQQDATNTYCCTLALASVSLFIRTSLWLKLAASSGALATMAMAGHPAAGHLFVVYLMFHVLDRQIDYISRLDFLWAAKLDHERHEARLMREVNQLLLENLLPVHVAHRFLANPEQQAGSQLYYEPYESCAVMFAAIPNFFKFYHENDANEHGLHYLSILNDIICEFDKLLMVAPFKRRIEKIKTIGSTYMAAAGLQPGRRGSDEPPPPANADETTSSHLTDLTNLLRFAMSMMATLARLNGPDGQFQLRVGVSMGPVVAGVVGAIKPQYDIWGDTVNVASRMDTGGVANKIQLPSHVAQLLLANPHHCAGFRPYSRGLQLVKGKGLLETYLIDYDPAQTVTL